MTMMRACTLLLLVALLGGCELYSNVEGEAPGVQAGGETTVFDATSQAFSLPAPNLQGDRLERHNEGDALFEQTFVTAPAPINGGLGPVFNNTSCVACHARDGRTRDVVLLRLSLPGQTAQGGPVPVAGFGTQLQEHSVFGVSAEATLALSWEAYTEVLSDGTAVVLRRPRYAPMNPYQPLPAHVLYSPRATRPVFGLGLLEAIPEALLLDFAARQAQAGRVSGRPNYVWDIEAGRLRVGRFGWKANQPSLLQQTAAAYHGDMGVTSPLFPEESSLGQGDGQDDGWADDPEIPYTHLQAVAFYVQTLGVPAPRNPTDPRVERGRVLFTRIGCADCHVPSLQTGTLDGVPEVSNQTIFPYADLLLHDMGEGLADDRPDYEAGGREWRTPPLWGLGLSEVVNGHTQLLHDGRATGVVEAILWHGGEGENSREQFRGLSQTDREALVAFLHAL
jgi:CxxC motif-containing protein (DUF1111 family)